MKYPDPNLSRVLYIDLTNKKFWTEDRSDLFFKYIGGAGVAINLLLEECPEGIDPYDPRNPIIFAVGPFIGVYPTASKTIAMFKSPLTGNLGESHAGGRSAVAIRSAGYGAIVIKGRSDIPVYLEIGYNKVQFGDASTLWGMRSSFTVGRVLRKIGEPGLRTIMRIGRAGERLVRYASVITETYRHFGRLGLGAVFGSKRLKAIVIYGRRNIPIRKAPAYRKMYDEIYNRLIRSDAMKKYHDIGTPVNVLPLNELGALPTKNLTQERFEYAEEISGENLAKIYLSRRVACAHCPVACIHLAALREPYEDEPYYYKTRFVSYDYEPIYALGSMLGIGHVNGLLKLLDEVELNGLDAMSTGVVLAWATEAFSKGLFSEQDTLGLKPSWGDYITYTKMVRHIVDQPNEFYRNLAQGVEYASSVYGGSEFALAFGKNEMPGYNTGPMGYLGFAIGARHSHLDNGGYSFDQKTIGKQLTPEDVIEKLMNEEEWRQVLSSLVVCFFARGVYRPDLVSRALEAIGLRYSEVDLNAIGSDIYILKYKFKFREGFSIEKSRIPKRIFEVNTPHGKLDPAFMEKALEIFKSKISELM